MEGGPVMFQAAILFCILGPYGPTCHSVYPDAVLPRETCETMVEIALDILDSEPRDERFDVWAFAYCKPVEALQ